MAVRDLIKRTECKGNTANQAISDSQASLRIHGARTASRTASCAAIGSPSRARSRLTRVGLPPRSLECWSDRGIGFYAGYETTKSYLTKKLDPPGKQLPVWALCALGLPFERRTLILVQ
jgi:hypothetical protein